MHVWLIIFGRALMLGPMTTKLASQRNGKLRGHCIVCGVPDPWLCRCLDPVESGGDADAGVLRIAVANFGGPSKPLFRVLPIITQKRGWIGTTDLGASARHGRSSEQTTAPSSAQAVGCLGLSSCIAHWFGPSTRTLGWTQELHKAAGLAGTRQARCRVAQDGITLHGIGCKRIGGVVRTARLGWEIV